MLRRRRKRNKKKKSKNKINYIRRKSGLIYVLMRYASVVGLFCEYKIFEELKQKKIQKRKRLN